MKVNEFVVCVSKTNKQPINIARTNSRTVSRPIHFVSSLFENQEPQNSTNLKACSEDDHRGKVSSNSIRHQHMRTTKSLDFIVFHYGTQ